jgi:hypothetical protein
MLWAILAVAAVAGAWVVYRLLFLETAPVHQESTITYDKPLRTKKSKAEKVDKKKKQQAATKKDNKPERKFKNSDDESEDEKPTKAAAATSPSSPAKTAFVQAAPSKKAQNRAARNGFQEVKVKARPTVTDEERERRDAARKEEEEERKKKEEARKLKQKERAEREEKEKEKQKEAAVLSSEQSIKDLLEKQRKEKEAAKAARTTKGGMVKVYSSPQSQGSEAAVPVTKKWEAPVNEQAEGSYEQDDESFPQLGRK